MNKKLETKKKLNEYVSTVNNRVNHKIYNKIMNIVIKAINLKTRISRLYERIKKKDFLFCFIFTLSSFHFVFGQRT